MIYFLAFLSGSAVFPLLKYFPYTIALACTVAVVCFLRKRQYAVVVLLALGLCYPALRGAPPEAAARPQADRWSTQEHAGHLCLVERLWATRFRELLRGERTLAVADMGNAATEAAKLNEEPLSRVLGRFRSARAETLELLDSLKLEDAARVAHHPRLGVAMRLVDLCTFAAEHDDHHMAMIRALLRSTSQDGR